MQTSNKLIIGITGPMASGKSTVTTYIKAHYGGVSFRFSDMLRDILKRIHVEEIREHMQLLSTFLRTTFGEDLMSKVLAQDVMASDEQLIIVEGIRRPSDVTYLKEMPGFHLIAVDADIRTRYERIIRRTENPDDQGKTFAQFEQEQAQESETKITEIMQDAEIVLHNDGDLASLHTSIQTFVETYTRST